MKPFLRQLAEAYVANEKADLAELCFVFPTRRAAQFFLRYLSESANARTLLILPSAMTIGEFCASFTDLNEASRLDELCILYNAYHRLSQEIPDFDRFRFWGDMILNDFADVDRSLADASMIFTNVSKYKEIASNYLTDEQREIISRYWPDAQSVKPADDNFWQHFSDDRDSSPFMRLWKVLAPLYSDFNRDMERAGLVSGGRTYRIAADCVAQRGAEDFPARRYIFAGFSMLSLAELKIFRRMRNLGIADFYWDCPPLLESVRENRALHFLRKYASEFPSLYDMGRTDSNVPHITVTAVPSGVGQVRLAADTLDRWVKDGVISDPANAVDTAVVLADESLFVPLTDCLPPVFEKVNVTLGFPLRLTPIASVMRAIVSMQLRARKIKGEFCFFYDDLITVASAPTVRYVDNDACMALIDHIRHNHLYTVAESELCSRFPALRPLFHAVKGENDFREVLGYIRNLVECLSASIRNDDAPARSLDLHFMRAYLQAVNTLEATVSLRGISIGSVTALQLVERLVSAETLHFEGRPIEGLQVMGIADTRSLDFSNIILTSMNERIYPRRHSLKSFIPENIRRAFALPTSDFIEASGAYNFFRLIAGAANVAVYYDSRVSGTGSSQMSRYIAQLLYLSSMAEVKHISAAFPARIFEQGSINVRKTPEIMEKLHYYTTQAPADLRKNLSASAINLYINCPLAFYLGYVEDLDLGDDPVDFMDSSTYGTVVHRVAQTIYEDLRGSRPEVLVTRDALRSVAANRPYLDRLITCSINYYYNHTDFSDTTPLIGETRILGDIIRRFIVRMLELEAARAPFTFISAEEKRQGAYRVDEALEINTTMIIDRVDRLNDGRMMFIDYKTGNDKTSFQTLDDLFDPAKSDRRKAILQLLLYANLYCDFTGYNGAVQPVIYPLKSIFTTGLPPISFNRKRFDDHRVVSEEFLDRINAVISEIFDSEVPFRQAENKHSCTFCAFKPICGREDV